MRLSFTNGREPHISESLSHNLNALLEREAKLPSSQRLECMILRWNSVRYLNAPAQSAVHGTDGLYEKIPGRWLRSVLPFIPHDESLSSDFEIPKIEYRDGGLYVDCLHTAGKVGIDEGEDYGNLYARLSSRVLTLIRSWYDEGRLVDPEQSLVKRWRLEPVRSIDKITLYKPSDDWGITQLTRGKLLDLPVSALLHDLAKGRERAVAIRVGINLVDYHGISKRLFGGNLGEKYHFSGGSLYFVPRDLDDLIRVLDGIDEVLYGGVVSGAVVTLTASRLSWINMYSLIVQRGISADTVVYVRRDIEPLFVFSFTVPIDVNSAAIRQEVVLRARRTLVYILDKSEDKDVHSHLDDPNAKLPDDLSSPTVRAHQARLIPDPVQF
jgi:hypothetical protein